MRKLVSTHLFRRQRLQTSHLEVLRRAGVEGVELFCARQSFDYRDGSQVEAITAWFRDNPLALHSVHSPIYADEREGKSGEPPINIADADPRRRLAAIDEVQRALEIAERAPFRYLVQHLGPGREEWDARKADRALTSLERIRILTKQAGATLLVENIPNGLSTPETLLAFLSQNHLNDVGVCFDSGHANMKPEAFGGGGVLASWEILGSRVKSTHLHDNDSSADNHRWIGDGTIPWAKLAPLLAQRGDDLPWLLEVGDHGETGDLATRLQQTFERLESWANDAA